LNEALIFQAKIEHLGYRYHLQDKNSELIFRYDNTPHFPDLPNFPHHKHNPAGTETSTSPSILAAIAEAAELSKKYERT
jgi:hypothetical protein